ncbi:MAG TPA: outer membrane protein assembly factor BamE, partial [Methylophilus sp.]
LLGCGSKLPAIKTYKMEIQQGNVVTSKMLLQLKPGMTKSQVRYIMGTPLIVDSFHDNRWDYFYQMRQQGKVIEKRRVILDFDKELLTSVRGDVVAAGAKAAEAPVDVAPRSVTPPKREEKSSWLNKLKFWKSDAPEAAVAAPTLPAEQAPKVLEAAPDVISPTGAPLKAETTQPSEASADDAESNAASAEPEAASPPSLLAVPIAGIGAEPSVLTPATPADSPITKEVAPVETAPEPVKASGTGPSAVPNPDAQAIQDSVNAWAAAWRNKDATAYLAAYSTQFKPDGLASRKAWAAQRKQRLADASPIIVELEDMTVQQAGNVATVQFFQKYSSKVYSDQVMKQLTLEQDAKTQRWLITKESVIENAQRPAQQVITAPEETSEHLDGVIERIGF